jgi:hypothetical protein
LAPQAIFAGVVAGFTIKLVQITRDLWVVTKESADAARKAADAADLSAHAALGMELPIVRATRPADLLMLDKPVPVDKPYGGIVADHFPSQYSAVSAIYFRNDGRTPAFPLQMRVGYRALGKIASGSPAYYRTILFEGDAIMKPEPREDALYAEMHYGIDLTVEEIAALKEGKPGSGAIVALPTGTLSALKRSAFVGHKDARP